ncbi:MAG: hypothetical protein Q9172_005694 [Xanthocarpia lactea]
MSGSNFPVRSVPPYVYTRSQIDSEDSLQGPSTTPAPWIPLVESQWAPIVREQKRQMERECPGARQVTWEEMNGTSDLESPPAKVRITPPKPAPVAVKLKARNLLMRKWYIPTLLRLIQWAFSMVALVVALDIFNHYDLDKEPLTGVEKMSALMAIVIDAVALGYLIVIHFFELTSKPMGVRPAMAIVSIHLLDLVFIVFGSVNLAFAWSNVVHRSQRSHLDHRQLALAVTLVIALIAWILTMVVSLLR